MVPMMKPISLRADLSTLNFCLLMFTQGILNGYNLSDEIRIRSISLNIEFNILNFRTQLFFYEPIILNTLLTNGLEKALPSRKISLPSIDHREILKVKTIDVSNDLDGIENVFI